MEKDFVPYEQALALKELGFDEPCFGYYVLENNGDYKLYDKCEVKNYFTYIEAPLYQQAFRWFREEHDLLGIPTHSKFTIMSNKWVGQPLYGNYNSYEEAELSCLNKLIEIVETKEK